MGFFILNEDFKSGFIMMDALKMHSKWVKRPGHSFWIINIVTVQGGVNEYSQ